MRRPIGNLWGTLFVALLLMGTATVARAQATSSQRIPIRKEKPRPPTPVTIHDTVTIVRVDTLRVVRVDTVFRADTLRDSCSRALTPFFIPIPIDAGHSSAQAGAAPSVYVTPEPATLFLLGSGLVGVGLFTYFLRAK